MLTTAIIASQAARAAQKDGEDGRAGRRSLESTSTASTHRHILARQQQLLSSSIARSDAADGAAGFRRAGTGVHWGRSVTTADDDDDARVAPYPDTDDSSAEERFARSHARRQRDATAVQMGDSTHSLRARGHRSMRTATSGTSGAFSAGGASLTRSPLPSRDAPLVPCVLSPSASMAGSMSLSPTHRAMMRDRMATHGFRLKSAQSSHNYPGMQSRGASTHGLPPRPSLRRESALAHSQRLLRSTSGPGLIGRLESHVTMIGGGDGVLGSDRGGSGVRNSARWITIHEDFTEDAGLPQSSGSAGFDSRRGTRLTYESDSDSAQKTMNSMSRRPQKMSLSFAPTLENVPIGRVRRAASDRWTPRAPQATVRTKGTSEATTPMVAPELAEILLGAGIDVLVVAKVLTLDAALAQGQQDARAAVGAAEKRHANITAEMSAHSQTQLPGGAQSLSMASRSLVPPLALQANPDTNHDGTEVPTDYDVGAAGDEENTKAANPTANDADENGVVQRVVSAALQVEQDAAAAEVFRIPLALKEFIAQQQRTIDDLTESHPSSVSEAVALARGGLTETDLEKLLTTGGIDGEKPTAAKALAAQIPTSQLLKIVDIYFTIGRRAGSPPLAVGGDNPLRPGDGTTGGDGQFGDEALLRYNSELLYGGAGGDPDGLEPPGFFDSMVIEPLTWKENIHGVVAGFDGTRMVTGDDDHYDDLEDLRIPTKPWLIASWIVTNLILLLIIVSVVALFVETLPVFYDGSTVLDNIESVCVGVFTLEVIVRFFTCPDKGAFFLSPLTWIDLLAIIPYYVFLFTRGASAVSALRILRLLRCFRVIKLVKNNTGFEAVIEALWTSLDALSLMAFMICLAVALFSTGVYFAELDGCEFDEQSEQWIRPDGEISPFQSVFHAFWWCIVTITTVGYGDDVPRTALGKTVAGLAALIGVFVISFPTAILGANFAEIHTRKMHERKERQNRRALLANLQKRTSAFPVDGVETAAELQDKGEKDEQDEKGGDDGNAKSIHSKSASADTETLERATGAGKRGVTILPDPIVVALSASHEDALRPEGETPDQRDQVGGNGERASTSHLPNPLSVPGSPEQDIAVGSELQTQTVDDSARESEAISSAEEGKAIAVEARTRQGSCAAVAEQPVSSTARARLSRAGSGLGLLQFDPQIIAAAQSVTSQRDGSVVSLLPVQHRDDMRQFSLDPRAEEPGRSGSTARPLRPISVSASMVDDTTGHETVAKLSTEQTLRPGETASTAASVPSGAGQSASVRTTGSNGPPRLWASHNASSSDDHGSDEEKHHAAHAAPRMAAQDSRSVGSPNSSADAVATGRHRVLQKGVVQGSPSIVGHSLEPDVRFAAPAPNGALTVPLWFSDGVAYVGPLLSVLPSYDRSAVSERAMAVRVEALFPPPSYHMTIDLVLHDAVVFAAAKEALLAVDPSASTRARTSSELLNDEAGTALARVPSSVDAPPDPSGAESPAKRPRSPRPSVAAVQPRPIRRLAVSFTLPSALQRQSQLRLVTEAFSHPEGKVPLVFRCGGDVEPRVVLRSLALSFDVEYESAPAPTTMQLVGFDCHIQKL